MISMRYKNRADWTFILWDGNPYVEVYRPQDLQGVKIADAVPFEAWFIGDASRTESTLKRIANENADYAKRA